MTAKAGKGLMSSMMMWWCYTLCSRHRALAEFLFNTSIFYCCAWGNSLPREGISPYEMATQKMHVSGSLYLALYLSLYLARLNNFVLKLCPKTLQAALRKVELCICEKNRFAYVFALVLFWPSAQFNIYRVKVCFYWPCSSSPTIFTIIIHNYY